MRRLIGIYDARGTVAGELAYVVGRTLGRTHCALCDITHGRLRERADWRACRARLRAPFDALHEDDRTPAMVEATSAGLPAVLADVGATDHPDLRLLLGPEAIGRCEGAPSALAAALDAAVAAAGFDWPTTERSGP